MALMQIKPCTYENAAEGVLELLNAAILNTTARYEYLPWTLSSLEAWFQDKADGNYPVLGAFSSHSDLLGFASYGPFRTLPANRYSLEHSVYVNHKYQGQGIAQALMQQLIEEAQQQGYHVLIGAIDAQNQASIALHQKLGFQHAGTLSQVGYKFDRWLDLALYQLLLDSPHQPAEWLKETL